MGAKATYPWSSETKNGPQSPALHPLLGLILYFWNASLRVTLSWCHHYASEFMKMSMQWRHASSPPPRKSKAIVTAWKKILSFFFDCRGPFLIEFLPQGSQDGSTYKKNHECLFCDYSTGHLAHLKRHINSHTGERPYICSVCGQDFRQKAHLKRHMTTHSTERPYKCNICEKSFKRIEYLKQHKLCLDIRIGDIHGRVCADTGATSSIAVAENKFVHGVETYEQYEASSFDNSSQNSDYMKCHILSQMDDHLFNCDLCGKSFRQKSNLNNHVRTHTGERPFSCWICGKDFAQKATLNYHMIRHSDERPHKCYLCSKYYSMCEVQNSRYYSCKLCVYSSAFLTNMRNHILTHTGERPFSCSLCGKDFSQKATLNHHMLTHSDLRPYKWEICGKAFKWKNSFKDMENNYGNETLSENLYKCSYCDYSTLHLLSLKNHTAIHSEKRPFICFVCGKDFRRKANLKDHGLIHSGTRPFRCHTCGKDFIQKSTLTRHMKVHTVTDSQNAYLQLKGF
ncbi:unnamed protein product [Larinioides sclopetarius]|uniref:C2H2-type domain-containing protein n=1 Tax=Larinioides sclopetarius TaxID=280406 RepID=A0AAV2AAH2_9ARAC